MAEPPLDKNLDDLAANQTSSGISGEEIDRGDIIIDHSSTRPELDKREDGHSKADVQRYPITNCRCELANEEWNEGVATSTDPTSSSAAESLSLPQNYTIHGPQNITAEESGMHDEARDILVARSGRPSMVGKSIGSRDNSCSPTLITDAADDGGSWQDNPNGRCESFELKLPDASGVGRSNLPLDDQSKDRLKYHWDTAIEEKDCKRLLQLWHQTPRRDVFEEFEDINFGGTTALHIAAMQGCYPLAKLLLDQFCNLQWFRMYIADVEPRSGLTALQMAHDVTGNRSVGECIKDYQNKESREPHLFASHPRTEWYRALRQELFCAARKLLRWNSRLLLETYHGVSVLHLAIWGDDFELVKEVMDLFGPEKKIKWGESYYPSELSWEKMCEINLENIEFNKLDFDQFSYLEHSKFKDLLHTERTALQLAIQLDRFTIRDLLKQYEDSPKQVASSKRDSLPKISASMSEFLQQEWDVHPEWEEEFMKDVDFNFEVEPRLSLLRFHHACKDPLKFKAFLHTATVRTEDFYDFSRWMHDGQGRTMFHLLLDHHTDDKPPGWALKEIFDWHTYFLYPTVFHARGRSLTDILLTKNYLLKNILIQPASYFSSIFQLRPDFLHYDDDTYFMLCHIAYILKQTSVAQHLLTIFVKNDNFKISLKSDCEKWLRIAASTGNYRILGVLLKLPLCDPTNVIDEKGRTALYYAADGSLLDHLEVLFEFPNIIECFSTVKDVGDFKMKWEEERRNSSVTFPSRGKDSNSMDEEVQFNVERKACILMLLQAGCDLSQVDKDGNVPNVGPTKDAHFQSWWYDLVVKDTTDKKNGFNQAGNALSVVGTLVAATSYIGPLQPPMSYTDGFVNIGEKLIEVFMATNTMAFYFAMASVMFAVVPSLPMPRESVMSELKRAQYMVSLSLCFLLVATIMIIISFAAASVVVIQHHQYRLRFGPTVIGWIVCILAIVSFLIRVMRLMFFENPTVKQIYQFSCIAKIKEFGNAIYRTRDMLCNNELGSEG